MSDANLASLTLAEEMSLPATTTSVLPRSRFTIVLGMYFTALVYFFLTRLVLLNPIHPPTLNQSDVSFIFSVGLLYDTVFYLYALLPVTFYLWLMPQRIWRSRWHRYWLHLLIFATVYGLGFIALAEYLFWQEFAVRFNFIAVDYLIYRREVTDNINQSYPVAWLLGGLVLPTLFVSWLLKPAVFAATKGQERFRQRGLMFALNVLVAAACIYGIGQGFREHRESVPVRELGSNGPYQFVAAFRNNQLNYREFYQLGDDKVLGQVLRQQLQITQPPSPQQANYDITRQVTAEGSPKPYNIMLIMVESLSAEFLGAFDAKQRGLMPELDNIAKQSIFFEHCYATGTRTTRGLEAVTLSIPPTPGRSIVKRIGRESNLWSLGNVLKEKGYDTRFIYGGRGYFDNMNAFFAGNGYDIMDQSSTPSQEVGFANAWGMADEYLYQQATKAAREAQQQGKPFFFHLMTTSNHRPYTYPEDRVSIPSGTGREGAVSYTDWALGDFFRRAQGEAWFDNTLFVVIGDHTAGGAGKLDLPLSRYHIPWLIYAPKLLPARAVDSVVSQIDVAPTLLGILQQSYQSKAFGRDVLHPVDDVPERALVATYQRLGYYTKGQLTILEPQQGVVQHLNPESEHPQVVIPAADDVNLLITEAYYQGADVVYSQGLDAWR